MSLRSLYYLAATIMFLLAVKAMDVELFVASFDFNIGFCFLFMALTEKQNDS